MVAKATLLQHPKDAGGLQVRMGTARWAEEGSRATVGGEVKTVGVEQGGREGFWKERTMGLHKHTHSLSPSLVSHSFTHLHTRPL